MLTWERINATTGSIYRAVHFITLYNDRLANLLEAVPLMFRANLFSMTSKIKCMTCNCVWHQTVQNMTCKCVWHQTIQNMTCKYVWHQNIGAWRQSKQCIQSAVSTIGKNLLSKLMQKDRGNGSKKSIYSLNQFKQSSAQTKINSFRSIIIHGSWPEKK